MHRYTRLLLASLAATAILAVAVGSVSANNLSVTNRNIRATWASLELSNNINSTTIRCPVTLEGSFSSATTRKVVNALIGRASIGIVNDAACTGGHATIHQSSLPWHIMYQGFIGRLPLITGITVSYTGAKFEIEGGIKCTATTSAESPARAIANLSAEGRITGLRADESVRFPLEGSCGFFAIGVFAGTGTVTLLGTTNAISVKLI